MTTEEFRSNHPWYTPGVEEAHRLLIELADRLDTTERRLSSGDLAQTLANLYALRVSLDTVVDLITGAVGVARNPPVVVRCVDNPIQPQDRINIYQRMDGTLFMAIPRCDSRQEQYGITWEQLAHIAEEAQTFLNARDQLKRGLITRDEAIRKTGAIWPK